MTAIAVSPQRLPRVMWQGTLVVTTDLLARQYEATEKQLQDNYQNNRVRFVEGKHYFLLAGDALRDFKRNRPDLIGSVVGGRAKSLILWTERGAARHAKMLETERAWDVFEALEDSYFSNRDRRSTMQDRAPLHHDAIDVSVQRRIALSKVYGAFNRWVGVKSMSAMSVEQVAETRGFSGRLKSNGETSADLQRIELHHAALYGDSRQLPLLGLGMAK